VLYTGNVGDARAVLFRDRAALRLSHDHKASDPLEQKRIKDAGGFVTNDRVNGILAVARSLGDHEMKEFVIGEPHTSRTELDAKDTVLVLACDGVWDILDDQAVCEMADQYSDPLDAAKAITDRSIEEGSSDNISTMVVYLQRRRQPGSIK
jgi:protein phosphatase PTC1